MTRPAEFGDCPPPPPVGAVAQALDEYRQRFPEAAAELYLPGRAPEREADLLRRAVARGRALRPWTLARVVGSWRRMPPPDVVL